MTILIEFKNISLNIANVDKPILSDISYQINQKDFVVLLGTNGSGKSSLLKLLDQRYQPTSGDILFEGKSLTTSSPQRIKTLTQNCNESLFTSLTIFENYLIVQQQFRSNLFSLREKQDREFLADYLLAFNPNLSSKLDQTVDKLSGGEKQALALALTVLRPPTCLLLDEHTSALDPKSAEHLMILTHSIIRKNEITCILTTHDLRIAEQYGNRLVSLRNGKIQHCIEPDEKKTLTQQHLLATCY